MVLGGVLGSVKSLGDNKKRVNNNDLRERNEFGSEPNRRIQFQFRRFGINSHVIGPLRSRSELYGNSTSGCCQNCGNVGRDTTSPSYLC